MTYEEAIRIINSDLVNYEEMMEARAIATSALEKQIPKKPIKSKILGFGFDCPNCGAWAGTILNDKFCHKCGQAIDWSFEKEDKK